MDKNPKNAEHFVGVFIILLIFLGFSYIRLKNIKSLIFYYNYLYIEIGL